MSYEQDMHKSSKINPDLKASSLLQRNEHERRSAIDYIILRNKTNAHYQSVGCLFGHWPREHSGYWIQRLEYLCV